MEADTFTFKVYIISYGRYARGPITAKCFTDYTHVVRKSQERDYIENGFENVWAIDDDLVRGYCAVYNYLVDNAPEDVIAIVDDDRKYFQYRTKDIEKIKDPEIVQAEFERLAQIIYDLDIGVCFSPPNSVPYNYTSEFAWLGIPGAFKIVNRHCVKAKMDADIWRNVDVDYVLQEVLMNRICLDEKYFVSIPYNDKDTRTTGSTYIQNDVDYSIEMMKLRWGKYFDYDEKKNIPKLLIDR